MKTYFSASFSGMISYLIVSLFLVDYNQNLKFVDDLIFSNISIQLFMAFVLYWTGFFPISKLDKEKVKQCSVEELFYRYLPLVILAPAALFCYLLFTAFNLRFTDHLAITISLLFMAYVGLWTFVNELKKRNHANIN